MKVKLIRHGKTPGNLAGKYIGSTDEPIIDGYHKTRKPDHSPDAVLYCSPMLRCVQTAAMLLPDMNPVIVDDLREMDFGVFERRSHAEMENDPQYSKWLDGQCKDRCPGGEHPAEFFKRACNAFRDIVSRGGEEIIIVTHGGVITAIMSRFCSESEGMEFSRWFIPNLHGYEIHVDPSDGDIRIIGHSRFSCEDEL